MALSGTYTRTLDEKQRVAVPKRLCEEFGESELSYFYVAPGTDQSLALYSPAGFDKLARKIAKQSSNRVEVRNYKRLFYSRAEKVELDAQGRIRIPDRLVTFAGLQRDLVLVGVSRTSKTPLSTLLAQRGLKVANLPLVLGVPTPPELEEANQERIVALTIGLDPLVEIRKARLKQLGMSVDANYGLKDQVKAELEYARGVFAQHPSWLVIDVTGRAIEETAVIILESLKERDEAKQIAKQIV